MSLKYPCLGLELEVVEHFVTMNYVQHNECNYDTIYDSEQGKLDSILRGN